MNIFRSILTYNCPRCRSSKMFKEPFVLTNPLDMNERCSVCKQHFEPEPGFYYGAMFISYAISIFLLFTPGLTLIFGFDWNVNSAMFFLLIIAAISYFKLMRLSRSIWIHINVRYDKRYKLQKERIVS